MEPKQILRNVALEELDYKIIKQTADEKGFGGKGFSAALRYIIRDWHRKQDIREDCNENQDSTVGLR